MLIEKVIRKLKGNPDYKWESKYDLRDLVEITSVRFKQVLRGSWKKIFFKASNGLVFIGTGVIIRHPYLFTAGANLILEDHVYINALSCKGIFVKDNVSLARNCTMICTGVIAHKGVGITIGNNSGINAGAYLAGQGGIEIGDDVIIGPGVKIFSENHNFSDTDKNIKDQGVTRSSVVIENNCWIGAGATILAGVTIGEGSVIAAGCVVTKSVASNSIVAGVPGRVLKNRKPGEVEVIIKSITRPDVTKYG
ncbi:Acetyltransferase (isoleucine patch superfamily) [Mucilaginibacter mallensis]|uniref:Acetyltransferase (Isoleucine patch superfamily) n=1 Tax=Mucilaginibacter mallensis TaxID=652787 RepID=A0A1H1WTX3_MUCMA|nr:acyltransferase [Mucilaginibacter mallensis]SDS99766.1 Acetyltransferase (isoleucine patch superfamily) [Mucilaginibacter mallensis]